MIVVDAHTHLERMEFIVRPIPPEKRAKPAYQEMGDNPPERLLEAMDRNQVQQAVAFPFPVAEVDPDLANGYVFTAAERHPGRFIPFALVGDDTEKWIARGARGFKQHFLLEPTRFDLATAYRAIARAGLPLIAHLTTRATVEETEAILALAPDIRLIIAHMGRFPVSTGGCVPGNLEALAKYPNVWFETSTVRDPETFRLAVKKVGADRICYGSDFPFNSRQEADPMARELEIMKSAGLSQADLEKVLGRNILALTRGEA